MKNKKFCLFLLSKFTFLLTFCLAPTVVLRAQRADSLAVVREVDSLVQVCKQMADKGQFEAALKVVEDAEKKALEGLGKWSVGYGDCLHNRGRIYGMWGKLDEAELALKDALMIREVVWGKEHPDYASTLNNLGNLYRDKGEYEKSERNFIDAKKIREKLFGEQHPDCAQSIDNLGFLYLTKGEYKRAEKLLLEAKKIREKTLGREHVDYANSLNHLSILYGIRGEYTRMEELLIEIRYIYKKLLIADDRNYASVLFNLANLYRVIGQYDKSEKIHGEIKEVYEKLYGVEHPEYTKYLHNLAVLYLEKGEYDRSEKLLLEAKSVWNCLHMNDHPDYLIITESLANLYYILKEYELSLMLFENNKKIYEKLYKFNHPNYVNTLHGLANIYRDKGEYGNAELLYKQCLVACARILGEKHMNSAHILHNLGQLYHDMGKYDEAESVYLKVISIREESIGKEHPAYASTLNNLANLYTDKEEYGKAEPLYIEARGIFEKKLGEDHTEYIQCLNNIANFYFNLGRYEVAEKIHLKVIGVRKKVFGTSHLNYAQSLVNLGMLHRIKDEYGKSMEMLVEAKNIYENTIGKTHPSYEATLLQLTLLYLAKGDTALAKTYLLQSNAASQALLQKAAKYSTEREFLQYAALFQGRFDGLLSFARVRPSDSLAMMAFDNTLALKSALAETAIARERYIAQADSIARNAHERWKGLRNRLARQEALPLAPNESIREANPKEYRNPILKAEWEKDADSLEKYIVRRAPDFGAAFQTIEWQQVRDRLRPNEAALEFSAYWEYDNKGETTGQIGYAALLLRPGANAPQFIPLCDQAQLEEVIGNPPKSDVPDENEDCYKKIYDDKEGNTLYKLLWVPLEPYLKNTQTIYYAPDGLIHRLNLDAIRDQNRAYLGKRYHLVRLGSTRRLALSPAVTTPNNQIVLFGGIPYGADSTQMTLNGAGTQKIGQSRGAFSELDSIAQSIQWTYIEGTKEEVENIAKIAKNNKLQPKLYTGYAAVEEAVKQVGQLPTSPRVLHIATHGYFFPDATPKVNNTNPLMDMREPVFKISKHPLIRSGLIFAGANHTWRTGKPLKPDWEDGTLTAYEVAQMNLANTELIVLSACETGLGDIKGNEGVYGLQRAFKAAGAKYILMSLWSVPDEATQQLMTAFYTHWLQDKMDIPTAFRTAQEDMKSKYPGNPYHWAGFVLVE